MLCFAKYNDNFGQYFEQKIFCILHKITKFSNVYYGHSNRKQEIQILFINYGFQKRIIMIYYFI